LNDILDQANVGANMVRKEIVRGIFFNKAFYAVILIGNAWQRYAIQKPRSHICASRIQFLQKEKSRLLACSFLFVG